MDAFEDERLSIAQADHIPFFASPGLEVVSWKLNFFAADKFFNIARKAFKVQGFKGFEVVNAVLIDWGFIAVDEIMIKLKRIRRNTARQQLDCKTARCG